MVTHAKREEEEMHLTNKQLEEINGTLIKLSEALILQSNKIEISSRDTLDKARVEFATKAELNGAIKSIRDSAKLIWLAILAFAGVSAFVINAVIELKSK